MTMPFLTGRLENKMTRITHRVARTLRAGVRTMFAPVALCAAVLASPVQAQTVALPKDEAPHSDIVEWFYFVGHLQGIDPAGKTHSYGYQMTMFQVAPDPQQPAVYVTNVAITDLTNSVFHTGSATTSANIPSEYDGFSLSANTWQMQGSSGSYSVNAQMTDQSYAIALNMQSLIPAAKHGTAGQIPYGPWGTSAYYSYTSLPTVGTIIDHGTPITVTGVSWQDHQWGNYNLAAQIGWTWFGIQLGNNTQYMLYFIQDSTGANVQVVATQVTNGVASAVPANQVSQTPLTFWTSPTTGYTYPTSWLVTVPGGSFTVSSLLPNQEFAGAPGYQSYYEADSSVKGTINGHPVSGVAFAEVNPYYQSGQLLP